MVTLVDVLAGITILASTALVLAPLSTGARASQQRTLLRLQAQSAIMATAPPTSAHGELGLSQPADCRLRWSSDPAQAAAGDRGGPLPARCVRMVIVQGEGAQAPILAERLVPLLGAPP